MNGTVRIERWACPAFGAAGPNGVDVGVTDVPLVLTSIMREGAGAATASARLLAIGTGGAKEAILEQHLTNSLVFNSGLAGGRVRLAIPVMPGRPLRFNIDATAATAAETWVFEFSAPELSRRELEALTEGPPLQPRPAQAR